MKGQAERQSRQPPENRSASKAAYRAERAALVAGLRSAAAQAHAFGFGLLRAQHAAKIAAARQRYSGDELAAVLAALHSEQRAAETALRGKLAGEARQRRGAALASHMRGKEPAAPRRPRLRRARKAAPYALK